MKLLPATPALALLLATGCTPVQMRLPAVPPESTDTAVLSGIVNDDEGRFTLADSEGSYARGAGYSWFGSMTQLRGGAAFVARGDAFAGELSAQCRSSATDIGGGFITLRARKMAYRCDYARDRQPIEARLVLDERVALLDERRGFIELNGVRIDLRSEHHVQASPLSVPMPAGYVFSVGGQVIGAIDLNGRSKRVLLPRDPRLREAALAAALSLALFIDAGIGDAAG